MVPDSVKIRSMAAFVVDLLGTVVLFRDETERWKKTARDSGKSHVSASNTKIW